MSLDAKTLAVIIKEVAVHEAAKSAAALENQIQALRMQVESLRTQLKNTPIEYKGVHIAGHWYRKGAFVTHNGSLWHANIDTKQRPADGPDWQMAVKAGRDGR